MCKNFNIKRVKFLHCQPMGGGVKQIKNKFELFVFVVNRRNKVLEFGLSYFCLASRILFFMSESRRSIMAES